MTSTIASAMMPHGSQAPDTFSHRSGSSSLRLCRCIGFLHSEHGFRGSAVG
ncbi:hypothetical protein AKJ09_11206 [Labilithrix luteola]|uniref:Uncharacterized protein n=1 Tax=Labilithrix luteola TaxID=1391654 RepID=A0A0K1QFP2_9BACT|nr:hypothetical protein AKJ09_11206 [Labilithrix luteola]